jgi:hypothetical protein
VVADSTGEVTSSGGLKAVNLKATNLKANDGTAGLVVADSTGRVQVSEKIETDDILEKTSDHGVEIDGLLIKDSEIASGAIGSAVTMSANQSAVKTALNAAGSAPIYAVRAWVNFNGTTGSGTGHADITIRGSGNVTSIADHGTGDFSVNFTTAMEDVNYSVSGAAQYNSTSDAAALRYIGIASATASTMATSALRIFVGVSNGNLQDPLVCTVNVVR